MQASSIDRSLQDPHCIWHAQPVRPYVQGYGNNSVRKRLRRATVDDPFALNRAFVGFAPQTLKSVAELLGQAVSLGLEDGRKLRADTRVIQTVIMRPRI
jgi:hypothetical protein